MSSDRTVLVTGGSRGLGLAIIRDLRKAGYRVATCSRSMSVELEAERESASTERFFWGACQIGDAAQESEFFHKFVEWAGKGNVWALVNNAGVAGEGILATFPNVDSERIINVNLVGALRMARLALQTMLQRPGPGRIVNISSIIAMRGYTGLAAYSASKAGLDGLTRSLAREVGRRGITVNSINPGYLETEMSSGLRPDQRTQIVRRTPMGRLGMVEDVAPVVRFLLSDDAAFVTGQTICVDGGQSN